VTGILLLQPSKGVVQARIGSAKRKAKNQVAPVLSLSIVPPIPLPNQQKPSATSHPYLKSHTLSQSYGAILPTSLTYIMP